MKVGVGTFGIESGLVEASRMEWFEEVRDALPRGDDKSMGIVPIKILLSKLVEEA